MSRGNTLAKLETFLLVDCAMPPRIYELHCSAPEGIRAVSPSIFAQTTLQRESDCNRSRFVKGLLRPWTRIVSSESLNDCFDAHTPKI
jgi:hypothetical protein